MFTLLYTVVSVTFYYNVMQGASGENADGEASQPPVPTPEKMKELEETINNLNQKLETSQEECNNLQ